MDAEFVAYHESGHAVAAVCLGMTPRRVSIRSRRASGIDYRGWVLPALKASTAASLDRQIRLAGREPNENVRAYLWSRHQRIMLMAGPCAAGLFRGADDFRHGAGDDLERTRELAKLWGAKTEDEVNAYIVEAGEEALNILRPHWSLVERVASELLERTTIYGAYVATLLRGRVFPDRELSDEQLLAWASGERINGE